MLSHPSITDWITAISTAILALGVLIAMYQLTFSKYSLRCEHERSRRERANDLLLEWSKNLNPKGSASRKFAEKLDKNQTIALFNQEEFEKDETQFKLLCAVVDNNDMKIDGQSKKYKVLQKLSIELRWEVVSYLNKLESIIMACSHSRA